MFLDLFSSATLAQNTSIQSRPIELGEDNALFVQIFVSAGNTMGMALVKIEASNDKVNWDTTSSPYGGGSLSIMGAAPLTKWINFTDLAARYVRIVVQAASMSGMTFNLSAKSHRL